MFTTVQFGKTRDFGANYLQDLLTTNMEITEEMLDVIEKVKGKRKADMWDHSCQCAMEANKKPKKPTVKTTVKEETTS